MIVEEYFASHSLNPDFLKKVFGVSWDEQTIVIPVYGEDRKRLYQRYRHLTGDTKFSSDKGAHPALFAVHKIKDCPEVVFCEGEPDCMRLWQEGIPSVTGTSGVKTFSTKIAKPLKGKTVYIVLDNDEAGRSTLEKYHEILLEAEAVPYIKVLPSEYKGKTIKDICDFFTAGQTKEEFLSLPPLTLAEWQEQTEPKEYSLLPGEDLLALPLPPEEWLIDRILPTEGFAFFVGAEATGKSFDTLSLAQAVTTGQDWLEHFPVKKKTNVLFIDKENTKRRTQQRMRGLNMTGENMFWLEYPQYFEVADEKEEDGFSVFVKAVSRKVKKNDIGLLVVDSFTDVMIGNENAASDTQRFFDSFRQLFPNICILVLHHENKPQQGVMRTSSQRFRGSTNITAQIVVGFRLEAIPKSKGEFTIEQTKAGDAERLSKFKLIMVVEPDPANPDKTIVKKLEYGGEVIDQEAKIQEAIDLIEDSFLVTSTLTRKQILEICTGEGSSEATTRRAIKEMTDEGIIDEIADPSGDKRGKAYVWIGEKTTNDE